MVFLCSPVFFFAVLNLSLLAIPTFQSIASPWALVQYWLPYSSANPSVLCFKGWSPAHHSLESHSSYSGTASNWNTRHTFISCNLPPSHLIKTLHPPLQLLPADTTHLCRSALQKSLFTRVLHFAENTYQADRFAGGNQWAVVCHANENTHNSCKLFVATSRTALAGNHQGPVAFSLYSTLRVRVHTS